MVPNLVPARYIIFGTSGKAARSSSFNKSAAIVSIPAASNSSRADTSENRDTPIIRFLIPACSIADLANIAILGPIFPPTPSNIISPSILYISAINLSDGLNNSCSSCSNSVIVLLIYYLKKSSFTLLSARKINISKPIAPNIFTDKEFTCLPIILGSLEIAYIAIPINGTKKMVTLCAKTISSKGSLPNFMAIAAPNIITIAIQNLTAFELS
ncbi:hypothetical protein D3C87_1568620 [compost metagenome]